MRKLIQIFVTLAFISVAFSANAQTKMATIIGVDTNYVQVYTDIPTTECQNVEVPITVIPAMVDLAMMAQL